MNNLEFDLANPPSFINVKANFNPSSKITLSEKSYNNLLENKVNLTIVQHGGKAVLRDVMIEFGARNGNFRLSVAESHTKVMIGHEVAGNFDISIWRESNLSVGDFSTSNGARIVIDNGSVMIGRDCMLADGILIQCGDQHGVIDIIEECIVNNSRKEIMIGDHVWLGRQVSVLGGVTIGSGAIIGLKSIVTRSVPDFVFAAGAPCQVVQKNRTWTRDVNSLDKESLRLIASYKDKCGKNNKLDSSVYLVLRQKVGTIFKFFFKR